MLRPQRKARPPRPARTTLPANPTNNQRDAAIRSILERLDRLQDDDNRKSDLVAQLREVRPGP